MLPHKPELSHRISVRGFLAWKLYPNLRKGERLVIPLSPAGR